MHLRTKSITLRLAIVATAALLFALAGTTSISLASDAVSRDAAGTTVGAAAALDTLPPGDTTALPPVHPQMMDDDGDFWNGWWIIMPVMMVLFWGGVLGVVVWGIGRFTRDRERDRSPLDIAKERLARGEITKEEFDRIRGDLA